MKPKEKPFSFQSVFTAREAKKDAGGAGGVPYCRWLPEQMWSFPLRTPAEVAAPPRHPAPPPRGRLEGQRVRWRRTRGGVGVTKILAKVADGGFCEMFHAEQRFRRKGETKMTNSQEIESQLAQYAGKLNAIERDRAQAGTDIDHGVAEVKRLEVLVELGEVQEAELVNTRRKIAKAGEQAQAANERLTLARRAQAELQERLAAARAEEATERWQARLKEYGGAATEILRLLEQAKMQLDRMEDAGAGFWRDGFRGVSKASQSAVKIWPEQLRHDLELLRARYGDGENE